MCKRVGEGKRTCMKGRQKGYAKRKSISHKGASGGREERMGGVRDNSVHTAATFPLAVIK